MLGDEGYEKRGQSRTRVLLHRGYMATHILEKMMGVIGMDWRKNRSCGDELSVWTLKAQRE